MTLFGLVLCVGAFALFVFPYPYFEYGSDMEHPWMACLIFPSIIAVVVGLVFLIDLMSQVTL